MSGNFLNYSIGLKELFGVQEGRCDWVERTPSVRASFPLEGRTSWIFSSCGRSHPSYDGDLRDPLLWPQERPVSMRVVRGLSGLICSRCQGLSPPVVPGRILRIPLQC